LINTDLIVEASTDRGYISYYKNDIAFVRNLEINGTIFETDLVTEYLSNIIKESLVVVDGGAHAGSHIILYKSINPDITIHAFEPQSRMFELLSHNINRNSFKNVFLYNLALANKDSAVEMGTSVVDIFYENNQEHTAVYADISYGDENTFNLGGLGFGVGGEEVKTTTIDKLSLERCDFIKLDLEGSEPLALLGATSTIKKFSPIILFEHNYHQLSEDLYKHFNVEKTTSFEILNTLGYAIEPIGTDNYLAYPIML